MCGNRESARRKANVWKYGMICGCETVATRKRKETKLKLTQMKMLMFCLRDGDGQGQE